jgi:hypothetical protein
LAFRKSVLRARFMSVGGPTAHLNTFESTESTESTVVERSSSRATYRTGLRLGLRRPASRDQDGASGSHPQSRCGSFCRAFPRTHIRGMNSWPQSGALHGGERLHRLEEPPKRVRSTTTDVTRTPGLGSVEDDAGGGIVSDHLRSAPCVYCASGDSVGHGTPTGFLSLQTARDVEPLTNNSWRSSHRWRLPNFVGSGSRAFPISCWPASHWRRCRWTRKSTRIYQHSHSHAGHTRR